MGASLLLDDTGQQASCRAGAVPPVSLHRRGKSFALLSGVYSRNDLVDSGRSKFRNGCDTRDLNFARCSVHSGQQNCLSTE
jgi:hypothetical protein